MRVVIWDFWVERVWEVERERASWSSVSWACSSRRAVRDERRERSSASALRYGQKGNMRRQKISGKQSRSSTADLFFSAFSTLSLLLFSLLCLSFCKPSSITLKALDDDLLLA